MRRCLARGIKFCLIDWGGIIKQLSGKKILAYSALAAIGVAAFWNKLCTVEYRIKSPKIIKTVKIILVSDLHSRRYGKNQQEIIGKISAQQPDIILLAGDIADDVAPLDGALEFLAAAAQIAKTYYVTGNHEFWSGQVLKIKDRFRSFDNVVILENTFDTIEINGNNLVIGGLDDPDCTPRDNSGQVWQSAAIAAFAQLDLTQSYGILLSHRPEKVDLYKKLPFDMIVSGHAHGGQLRIPFLLNGLVAPNQGFFPKYAGGLYEYSSKVHIVSRGASFHPYFPRVFNPPEIVAITLSGATDF